MGIEGNKGLEHYDTLGIAAEVLPLKTREDAHRHEVVPVLEDALMPWATGGLVLYNLLIPIVPIKTTATYDAAWAWSRSLSRRDRTDRPRHRRRP